MQRKFGREWKLRSRCRDRRDSLRLRCCTSSPASIRQLARAVRLNLIGAAIDAPSGLTVTVNLLIERRAGAISVPRSAVIPSGSLTRIRVVGTDNVVIERTITYVDWPAEVVIVTSGLQPGERILTEPDSARLGERVQVTG